MQKSTARLTTYSGETLPVVGKTSIKCSVKDKTEVLEFQIVKTHSKPILGLQACQKLNLIKIVGLKSNIYQRSKQQKKNYNESDKINGRTHSQRVSNATIQKKTKGSWQPAVVVSAATTPRSCIVKTCDGVTHPRNNMLRQAFRERRGVTGDCEFDTPETKQEVHAPSVGTNGSSPSVVTQRGKGSTQSATGQKTSVIVDDGDGTNNPGKGLDKSFKRTLQEFLDNDHACKRPKHDTQAKSTATTTDTGNR